MVLFNCLPDPGTTPPVGVAHPALQHWSPKRHASHGPRVVLLKTPADPWMATPWQRTRRTMFISSSSSIFYPFSKQVVVPALHMMISGSDPGVTFRNGSVSCLSVTLAGTTKAPGSHVNVQSMRRARNSKHCASNKILYVCVCTQTC